MRKSANFTLMHRCLSLKPLIYCCFSSSGAIWAEISPALFITSPVLFIRKPLAECNLGENYTSSISEGNMDKI